jgi:hypothetical protein
MSSGQSPNYLSGRPPASESPFREENGQRLFLFLVRLSSVYRNQSCACSHIKSMKMIILIIFMENIFILSYV